MDFYFLFNIYGGGEIMEVKIMLYPDRTREKIRSSSSNSSAKSFLLPSRKDNYAGKNRVAKELGSVG